VIGGVVDIFHSGDLLANQSFHSLAQGHRCHSATLTTSTHVNEDVSLLHIDHFDESTMRRHHRVHFIIEQILDLDEQFLLFLVHLARPILLDSFESLEMGLDEFAGPLSNGSPWEPLDRFQQGDDPILKQHRFEPFDLHQQLPQRTVTGFLHGREVLGRFRHDSIGFDHAGIGFRFVWFDLDLKC